MVSTNIPNLAPHPRHAQIERDRRSALMETFGVRYFAKGEIDQVRANERDLYDYTVYIGPHLSLQIERGDSCYWLEDRPGVRTAHVVRGPVELNSEKLAVVVRGYMPPSRSVSLPERTNLPYVNGCSTRQLIHAERLGDPTLQMLDIPPHAAEQAHHIHSTVRVVYILAGRGFSVVGMDKKTVREELLPGMVVVLQPMCPHHFETEDEHLVCVPLHVWSSIGGREYDHPMFNGTHLTGAAR